MFSCPHFLARFFLYGTIWYDMVRYGTVANLLFLFLLLSRVDTWRTAFIFFLVYGRLVHSIFSTKRTIAIVFVIVFLAPSFHRRLFHSVFYPVFSWRLCFSFSSCVGVCSTPSSTWQTIVIISLHRHNPIVLRYLTRAVITVVYWLASVTAT